MFYEKVAENRFFRPMELETIDHLHVTVYYVQQKFKGIESG